MYSIPFLALLVAVMVVVVVVVVIYPDLSPGGYAGYHNYLYLYV
jgi:hypothetical protein